MRASAIALHSVVGDADANLAACDRLVRAAVTDGAELVALPEFFTTSVTFDPKVADAIEPYHGRATAFLASAAREHGIFLGGSFLSRDGDGEVRNAYVLAGPDGTLLGRHDKDVPSFWENAFYVGGRPGDDGVIDAGEFTAGAAVCWEFMRTQTARRLRGRIDVIVAGSNWWSLPEGPPGALTSRWAPEHERLATQSPGAMARLVGAPVVHATHVGRFACGFPDLPGLPYRGRFVGAAVIAAADGTVLAHRRADEGEGVVTAEVHVGRSRPLDAVPDRYWLHKRVPPAAAAWHTQRISGQRYYAAHVRGVMPHAGSATPGGTQG
jgi:predicted amidohydrolase